MSSTEQQAPQRKTLAQVGKIPLIGHLSAKYLPQNDSTLLGVGHDAPVALFSQPLTVTAQHLALEGTDFDLTYVPLKYVGYKTAVGAMGRVVAMNATPMQLLVSVGLSQRFYVDDLDALFDGIAAAGMRYGADLVFIDLRSSYTGLSVAVTCVGQATPGELTRRDGAQENDLICLSGDVGAAYMGLQLLEREKRVFTGEDPSDKLPQLEGFEYILERYLRPDLPTALLANLRQDDLIPTSMCLVLNGLAPDLWSICHASGVGAKIFLDKIPIARQTFLFADQAAPAAAQENADSAQNENAAPIDPIVAALNGGEDYQLLFTLPLAVYEQLSKEYSIDVIGHICPQETGCVLVTPQGQQIKIDGTF